jgi:hypothetical protein
LPRTCHAPADSTPKLLASLSRSSVSPAKCLSARLLRIPRDSIVEVTKARSHLGKWIARDLLKVVWTTDLGTQDSIALWVRDLDGWLEALRT